MAGTISATVQVQRAFKPAQKMPKLISVWYALTASTISNLVAHARRAHPQAQFAMVGLVCQHSVVIMGILERPVVVMN